MLVKSFFRHLFTLCLGILLLATTAQQAKAQAQRMLLLPTSTVELLGPGESRIFLAMCLDFHRDTPSPDIVFERAPGGGFGNGSVKIVRGSSVDLNRAIQLGAVSVTGTDSYQSVRITNNRSVPISVSIPAASVVTPPSLSSTSDLAGLPQIGATDVDFDQNSLWATRALMDAGVSPDDENLEHRSGELLEILEWMDKTEADWKANGRVPITIHRVDDGRKVRYYLYWPYFSAKLVDARDLPDLIPEIRRIASEQGATARVYVFGDGTRSELDAAELTISFGMRDYVVGRDFDFGDKEPSFPDHFGWGRGGDGGRDTPVTFDDDGWRSKLVSFLKRGTVRLSIQSRAISAWRPFFAGMSVGVVEAEEEPRAAFAPADEVSELIERHIQDNFDLVKQILNYGVVPPGAALSETNLDGALFRREYVELWIDGTRFAVLEFHPN